MKKQNVTLKGSYNIKFLLESIKKQYKNLILDTNENKFWYQIQFIY